MAQVTIITIVKTIYQFPNLEAKDFQETNELQLNIITIKI